MEEGNLPQLLLGDVQVQLLRQRRKVDCKELSPSISASIQAVWDVHHLEDLDAIPAPKKKKKKY